MNYFELFHLPVSFDVDNEQLEKQLRQLQSQHHPDVQTDSHAQKKAEQLSAVINNAYQALKYPDSRASHLLELAGQGDNLEQSIRDLDFLDKAMDFRIELDEAENQGLLALNNRLQSWLAELSNQFHQAYINQNWQQAVDFAQKLKFLVKIDKDITKKVDALSNLSNQNNDDDLYV